MQVTKKRAVIERSNPLTVSFRASDTEANVERYEAELSPKPYYQSARIEFITASLLSYLANVVSVITAFSFLLFNLIAILPDMLPDGILYGVGGFISLAVLLALEATKRTNTTNYFKVRIVGKQAATRNVIVLLILSLASVGFSGLGAGYLAELATDESKVIAQEQQVQLSEVQTTMDGQVDRIEGEILELENGVKQAIKKRQLLTMPDAVARTIEGKRNEIATIRARASEEKKAVIDSFVDKMATNNDNTRHAQYFMVGVALVAEVLAILCLWFVVYYKYRAVLETRSALDGTKAERPTEHTNTGGQKDECLQCGNEYAKRAPHQKFCSKECRLTYHEEKKGIDLSRFRASCFLPLVFVPFEAVLGIIVVFTLLYLIHILTKRAKSLIEEFKRENKRLERSARKLRKESEKWRE